MEDSAFLSMLRSVLTCTVPFTLNEWALLFMSSNVEDAKCLCLKEITLALFDDNINYIWTVKAIPKVKFQFGGR